MNYHDQWVALGKDPNMGMTRELDVGETEMRATIQGCTCDAPTQRRLEAWGRWEFTFTHRTGCKRRGQLQGEGVT